MIAPIAAKALFNNLENETVLNKEISIDRFQQLYLD